MVQFDFKINDSNGIHARPAGLVVKEASKFTSDISIEFKGKTADAKKIFAIMSMGLKKDDVITVITNGEDEKEAAETLESFMQANL